MFLLQIQKVRNKHSNHKPNQNPFHFCFSFLLSSSILIHFQISNAPLTNPAVAKKYQIYKRKVFILIFHLSFSFQISKWFQEQQEKGIFVSTFYSSSYNSAVSVQFSNLPLAFFHGVYLTLIPPVRFFKLLNRFRHIFHFKIINCHLKHIPSKLAFSLYPIYLFPFK